MNWLRSADNDANPAPIVHLFLGAVDKLLDAILLTVGQMAQLQVHVGQIKETVEKQLVAVLEIHNGIKKPLVED